ncbi:MAG: alginate lyase family protein, partial [Gammaproteobacteria bacterium]|nr:alginate lyase family protein [Gammaproteobacteria bacterium]
MQHVSRVWIASISAIVLATVAACTVPAANAGSGSRSFDLVEVERQRILAKAPAYLHEAPVTVTAHRAARSAGGLHDFYSEGDYWWPDPDNPDGPYVRRDGISNPDNFVAHRRAMVRLSEIVATLTSAWIITRDEAYASHARK